MRRSVRYEGAEGLLNMEKMRILSAELRQVKKTYGEKTVLSDFSYTFFAGGRYALVGESGCGKTTLLKLLMGIEKASGGSLVWKREKYCGAKDRAGSSGNAEHAEARTEVQGLCDAPQIAAVFQEDRLCERFSAAENVCMCLPQGLKHRAEAERELLRVLPAEALAKPCEKLSGGQKRRVAVVRAASVSAAEVLLLDEPFTGLDEATKQTVIDYLLEKAEGKLLIIATHEPEDIRALGIASEHVISFSSERKP